MKKISFLLLACLSIFTVSVAQNGKEWIETNYTKREVMIPMRDGVKLYTAIYEPVHSDGKSPVLMTRTPYKAAPYGRGMDGRLSGIWHPYAKEKYIFVVQDVRGRWKSEGVFVNVRPFIADKKGKETDEASDVYDTVEWLLKNVGNNNGKVAAIGSSYSGFYSLMAGLSGHPAIKAVVPQAPVTDWFMGDDFHHNGALILCDAFRFNSSVNRPRPVPTEKLSPNTVYYSTDEYSFFLETGALKNFTALLGDSIQFWNDMMKHPVYDSWWQQRDTRRACYGIHPAVLIVGGLFDAEDCYGTWELYKAINKQSKNTDLQLVVGPWYHGGWGAADGSYLGNIRFGMNTSLHYRTDIEYPFLQYYLKGEGVDIPASRKVRIFFSGENQWHDFPVWPPKEAVAVPYYLSSGGHLLKEEPHETSSYSEYISDPAKPVPYTDKTQYTRTKEYMTDDQRFAGRRPDVLCFKTPPLDKNVKVGGPLIVELEVALSTTDADFVVKLIDEFPEDFAYDAEKEGKGNGKSYLMCGYQMLVRGEVMRGRFRNSFEYPEAFVPGVPAKVCFVMPDIAHTFGKGHRIGIQIQSTWFPLVDRNPQQFVDIYTCEDSDFVKSEIKLFHQKGAASKIILPVLGQ